MVMSLKKYRKREGLTMAEMGRRCGVTHTTISRWESEQRKPDLARLKKIIEATGGQVTYKSFTDRRRVA